MVIILNDGGENQMLNDCNDLDEVYLEFKADSTTWHPNINLKTLIGTRVYKFRLPSCITKYLWL